MLTIVLFIASVGLGAIAATAYHNYDPCEDNPSAYACEEDPVYKKDGK